MSTCPHLFLPTTGSDVFILSPSSLDLACKFSKAMIRTTTMTQPEIKSGGAVGPGVGIMGATGGIGALDVTSTTSKVGGKVESVGGRISRLLESKSNTSSGRDRDEDIDVYGGARGGGKRRKTTTTTTTKSMHGKSPSTSSSLSSSTTSSYLPPTSFARATRGVGSVTISLSSLHVRYGTSFSPPPPPTAATLRTSNAVRTPPATFLVVMIELKSRVSFDRGRKCLEGLHRDYGVNKKVCIMVVDSGVGKSVSMSEVDSIANENGGGGGRIKVWKGCLIENNANKDSSVKGQEGGEGGWDGEGKEWVRAVEFVVGCIRDSERRGPNGGVTPLLMDCL